jgi:ubiquinone/menaquinone biosynthesis C-methylase UbiE
MTPRSRPSTSWQSVSKWYDESVGEKGHYYHQSLIIPRVLKLLGLNSYKDISLLDLACGQGVLARALPEEVSYVGLDLAKDLIRLARQHSRPHLQYEVADVTGSLPIKKMDFTHATVILALQNIEEPLKVFQNVARHLQSGGRFIIVLNHPCFRIPRQSSWGVDQENKLQYRRINRYMSPLKIPIQAHPSKGEKSANTWSFHHALSDYSRWLQETGFTIDLIEEWCSDKSSEGKMAKMENRSRAEFPLFMAIMAIKK